MMLKLLVVILSLLGCTTSPTQIKEITPTEYIISGELDSDGYERIRNIINLNKTKKIVFRVTSPGGSTQGLYETMDAIHRHGQVYWRIVGYCDSACGILALSSTHATGKIRLHSASRYSTKGDRFMSASDNNIIISKLKSYGYNTLKFEYMFNSIYIITSIDLLDGQNSILH